MYMFMIKFDQNESEIRHFIVEKYNDNTIMTPWDAFRITGSLWGESIGQGYISLTDGQ